MSLDPLLELNKHGHPIGKNPLDMDVSELKAARHEDIPLAKAIRKNCIECCGFEKAEVRKCVSTSCAEWPFRMGVNPFLAAKRKGKGGFTKQN